MLAQGFLTGVLQAHARKYHIPINALEFTSSHISGVSPQDLQRPVDGVVIYGLWMEGASWDRSANCLADATSRVLFSVWLSFAPRPDVALSCTTASLSCCVQSAPPFHLLPAVSGAASNAGAGGASVGADSSPPMYECPVYKTTARAGALSTTGISTNYILTICLPTPAVPPAQWIRRGVALVCDLND
jgi:dynein heavy chain